MKKTVSFLLILTMVLALFAGCGGNSVENTDTPGETAKPKLEGTLEELLTKVTQEQPVEFMGGVIAVDVTDTSEDGAWSVKYYTGLDSTEQITEAAAFEPMMGSIPFSMVMVRVGEGQDVRAVAEAMKTGIDTRKWICVEADDLMVAGYGDVVMLIMVGRDSGMSAQTFVDAFEVVCGAQLDFTI